MIAAFALVEITKAMIADVIIFNSTFGVGVTF
jgi:hypothetical protein